MLRWNLKRNSLLRCFVFLRNASFVAFNKRCKIFLVNKTGKGSSISAVYSSFNFSSVLKVKVSGVVDQRVKVASESLERFLLVGSLVLGASKTTGSSGGDETDFATGGSVATDGGRHTDVLMVTTTVRMLDRVHGDTTDLGPRVPLGLVFEVSSTGLEQRLIDSSATGDDANHSAIAGRNGLLGSRGQFHLGLVLIGVVGDDGGVVARGSGEFAAVSHLLLELADDGSLGHSANGHHVSDRQVRLLAAVHELARVHALHGDERLLTLLELVRISKLYDGERRSASGVVDDVLDDALDVSMTLGVVDGAKAGGALAMFVVRREDGTRSLTLRSNHSTHFLTFFKSKKYFKQIETTQL